MNNATSSLPVLASTDLDIYDADQRARIPAAAGIAATTPALRPNPFDDIEAVRAVRREDLPPLTDRAIKTLGQIHQAQADNPGPVADYLDLVKQGIWQAGDSPAVLDQVIALMEEQQAARPAPCPVYSWCVEQGEHEEHYSQYSMAPNPDAYGRDVLPVGLTNFQGSVTVGLLDLDLTPAEARDRLAELRAHLDHVERLITLAEQGAVVPAAEHTRAEQ
ncbi:hypothetical protein ABT264_11300 [Streptomyces virginiae]|uniref:hypothetical protein n=1 Tax=Streptomyces virginiae TaxID=1961 RepID=UPI00332284F2